MTIAIDRAIKGVVRFYFVGEKGLASSEQAAAGSEAFLIDATVQGA